MTAWFETFFDEAYLELWGGIVTPERSAREAEALWTLLALEPGRKLLDAPCGFGRLSRVMAEHGANVLGLDLSETMLARAESQRDGLAADRLRYARHDLRQPIPEGGFDAAMNVFSSIGYGSDEDDAVVVRNLAAALRPGGRFVLDVMHRDAVAARIAHGPPAHSRYPDGTIMVEEPRLDVVTGRVETCWYWAGPRGVGSKPASLRMYTVTELLALIARAGLRVISLHAGCLTEAFRAEGPTMGGRVAILAERPA